MSVYFYFLYPALMGAGGAWFIYMCGSLPSRPADSRSGLIPNGGGIGILAAFLFSSFSLNLPLAFWLPAALVSLVSLSGDRVDIFWKLRLPVQFVAAAAFLSFSFRAPVTFHILPLMLLYVPFIVFTASCYNFTDSINGIAGISGIVGFGLLAFFNIISGSESVLTVLCISVVLSCLGFIPFNFPKARVLMGNVGSILLGFVFASVVVLAAKNFLDFVCLAGFLFPFYADEFVTTAVRLKNGKNLPDAHISHFYKLLSNELGVAHWKVSTGYGLLQLTAGICILLLRPFGIIAVISLLLILLILFVYANYLVRTSITSHQ